MGTVSFVAGGNATITGVGTLPVYGTASVTVEENPLIATPMTVAPATLSYAKGVAVTTGNDRITLTLPQPSALVPTMTWVAVPSGITTSPVSPAFPLSFGGHAINNATRTCIVGISGTPTAGSYDQNVTFTLDNKISVDGGTMDVPPFDIAVTVSDLIANPSLLTFTQGVPVFVGSGDVASIDLALSGIGNWDSGSVSLTGPDGVITSEAASQGTLNGLRVNQSVSSGTRAIFTFSGTPTEPLSATLTISGTVGGNEVTARFRVEIQENMISVRPSFLRFAKGVAPTSSNMVTASLDEGAWRDGSVQLFADDEPMVIVPGASSSGTWNSMRIDKTLTGGTATFTFIDPPKSAANTTFTIKARVGESDVAGTFVVLVVAQPEPLEDVLSDVNASLSPHSVIGTTIPAATSTEMNTRGITTTTPISRLLPSAVVRRSTPIIARPAGYGAAAPSVYVNVELNSDTTGDALALSYTVDAGTTTGLSGWGTLTDAQRLALLASDFMFSYEYPTRWVNLIGGASALTTWESALGQNIISFTSTGIKINYVVVNSGMTTPFVAGSMIVIPDGTMDNYISDPLWLMSRLNAPATGLTITPKPYQISVGQSVTVAAAFSPANPESREVIWATSDANVVAKPTRIGNTDTYSIQGLTRGIADLTAYVDGNTAIKDSFTVTVGNNYDDDDDDDGSSSCNAFSPAAALLAGALFLLRKKNR